MTDTNLMSVYVGRREVWLEMIILLTLFLFILPLVRLKMSHSCCWSRSFLPQTCQVTEITARCPVPSPPW